MRLLALPVLTHHVCMPCSPKCEPAEDCWGSNPVEGRDWGISEPCSQAIIDAMLRNVEKAFQTDATMDSFSETAHGSMGSSNSSFYDKIEVEASSHTGDEEQSRLEGSSSSEVSEVAIPARAGAKVQFSAVIDPSVECESTEVSSRELLRRQKNLAKRRRTALLASVRNPVKTLRDARKSMFVRPSMVMPPASELLLPECSPEFYSTKSLVASNGNTARQSISPRLSPLHEAEILEKILDFLPEHELLLGASLVSRAWYESATHSHANLMLASVGCSRDSNENQDELQPEDENALTMMERPWNYITSTFPWACFLSEGAYKRVYRVFNHKFGVEEAVSVMCVHAWRLRALFSTKFVLTLVICVLPGTWKRSALLGT